MIEIIPFEAIHAKQIEEQPKTRHLAGPFRNANMETLEKLPTSFTLKYKGEILFCGGIVPKWEGCGGLWSILAGNQQTKFQIVHKRVKKFFDEVKIRRLEATVALDFPEAHRWVKLLGFECEAPILKGFYRDGKDAALYARVRK